MPSQRRNTDTYMLETWRSDSPERYTYHSNFRRGAQSQRNSPTRHSSLSPDGFRTAKAPVGSQRRVSLSRCQASSRGSSQLPSYAPSPNTSGRSSPARRRGSTASRAASPTRCTPSRRQLQKDHGDPRHHRSSRSESQLSNKHSLDSEKLYRNLESISRRGSTVISRNSFEGSKGSPPSRTAVNSSVNTFSCNSGDASPSRTCYSPNSPTPQGDPIDHRLSPSQRSWKGSAYSLLSPPPSHYSSTSRRGGETPLHVASPSPAAVTGSDKDPEWNTGPRGGRSGSNMRRGMDSLLVSQPKRTTENLEEVCSGCSSDCYRQGNVRIKC